MARCAVPRRLRESAVTVGWSFSRGVSPTWLALCTFLLVFPLGQRHRVGRGACLLGVIAGSVMRQACMAVSSLRCNWVGRSVRGPAHACVCAVCSVGVVVGSVFLKLSPPTLMACCRVDHCACVCSCIQLGRSARDWAIEKHHEGIVGLLKPKRLVCT